MAALSFLYIGLGLSLVAAVVVLACAVTTRRHKEHLARLGKKHALSFYREPLPATELAVASFSHGHRQPVKLTEVMMGADSDGRFHLARRKIRRRWSQLLFFETPEDTHLQGFRVEPRVPERRQRTPRRKILGRRGREEDDSLRFRLTWDTSSGGWSDERALSMGMRLLHHLSQVAGEESTLGVGLEVHGRRVLIYSTGRLKGDDLDRFFASALGLRRMALNALRKMRKLDRTDTRPGSTAARTSREPTLPASPKLVLLRP